MKRSTKKFVLLDAERDDLYDAAIAVWNRWVARKRLSNKVADEAFKDYIIGVWKAAERLK